MENDLRDRLVRLNAEAALGLGSGEDAVRLACDLLVAGVDTPALAELAGESPTVTWADAGPLVRQALTELGIEEVELGRASWIVTRHIARRTLAGELSLEEGAGSLVVFWQSGDDEHELAKRVVPLDIARATLLYRPGNKDARAEVKELVEDLLREAEERLC